MWQIIIDPLVEKEDFKNIPLEDQRLILRTLRKKLSLSPDNFGKPLAKELKGYRCLRVADYRVIYRILHQQVIVKVVKIGARRDDEVYEEMLKRLPYLPEL